MEHHSTSLHVLREWKHIVEGTSVDILNALRQSPTDLSSVLAVLGQGWGRSPGHRLRILSIIAAGEGKLDRELMEIRAERMLRLQADEMFHAQIDRIHTGSQCGLATNVATRSSRGKWKFSNPETASEWCKKTDKICRQDDDLDGKPDRLRVAAGALADSAPYKPMAKAAQDAANDRSKRKGSVCFRRLGDVSIALECQPDEVVLTTDRSFEVMAPALGIDVHRFDPTPPP